MPKTYTDLLREARYYQDYLRKVIDVANALNQIFIIATRNFQKFYSAAAQFCNCM